MIFRVPQITRHKKVIYLHAPVKPVFLFKANSKIAITFVIIITFICSFLC